MSEDTTNSSDLTPIPPPKTLSNADDVISKKIAKVYTEGLDPKTGKFAKGNKLGTGCKPHMVQYNMIRDSFLKEVKRGDIKTLARNAIDLAMGDPAKGKRPDYNWAKLVLEYILPKPKIEAELTTIELSPEEASARIKELFGTNE